MTRRKKIEKNKNLCGDRVRAARAERRMTQLELAVAVDELIELPFDSSSVGGIESGTRFVRDIELHAMAEVLEKNPLWLLYGDNVPDVYKP